LVEARLDARPLDGLQVVQVGEVGGFHAHLCTRTASFGDPPRRYSTLKITENRERRYQTPWWRRQVLRWCASAGSKVTRLSQRACSATLAAPDADHA
jgi:hypothetical protein